MIRGFAVLFLLVCFAFNTTAHEYWFEPDTFFAKPGEMVPVHLYVGDGLVKDREERVYQPEKTELFKVFGLTDLWDLRSKTAPGAMPVYTFSADKPGNYLLAMERNWSYITLEADKFEEYLVTDGIDFISKERAKLGESKKKGKERYSRFIKSLMQVGGRNDLTWKKEIGLKLEISPLANPYTKKVGDTLQFRVTFDGKPLANRTIFADNRASQTQRFKTNARGEFTMKIDNAGLWLVRMVTMRRCKTDCGEADWESFWAAYSFGVN